MSPYKVYLCGTGDSPLVVERTCPNWEQHTPQPKSYMDWHRWAEAMSKGFRQRKCPGCGRYEIWEPKGTKMEPKRSCRCGRIMLGSEATEHRNWNPDCPEHGLESDWWKSSEQVEKRRVDSERLRNLWAQARAARAATNPGPS